MSITRVNEFTAAENKSEELYEFLLSLVPYISSSTGSISVDILKCCENEDDYLVIEKWDSIESHKLSVESFPTEKMQLAMPLLGGAPKGRYYQQ